MYRSETHARAGSKSSGWTSKPSPRAKGRARKEPRGQQLRERPGDAHDDVPPSPTSDPSPTAYSETSPAGYSASQSRRAKPAERSGG